MAKESTLSSSSSSSKAIPPPINGVEMERIDYVPLKKQLNNVLKDKSDLYWDTLKQFFSGRMTKRELDHFVLLYLTESHLKLHNTFIRALLHNSLYANTQPTQLEAPKPIPKKKILTYQQPPQPSVSTKEKESNKHRAKDKKNRLAADTTTSSSKPKKPKSSSSSSSSSSSASSSSTSASASSTSSSLSSSTSSRRLSKASSSTNVHPEASQKTKEKRSHPKYSLLYSPQVQALKDRMETIACESGLNGVSRQSVIYMMLALERHIKDILYNSNPQFTDSHQSHYFYNNPLPDHEDYSSDDEYLPPNQRPPPQYLAYQYDSIHHELQNLKLTNHPTTSGLTLKSFNNNNNNNNNNNVNTTTTTTTISNHHHQPSTNTAKAVNDNNDGMNIDIVSTITAQPTTTTTTSIINETTKMDVDKTPAIIQSPTPTSSHQQQQQQQQHVPKTNPNYFISKNPLLSFGIPVYKIPNNLFNNHYGDDDDDDVDDDNDNGTTTITTTTTSLSTTIPKPTLSPLDIYTTIEMNPYILGEDTLNFERINLNRYK